MVFYPYGRVAKEPKKAVGIDPCCEGLTAVVTSRRLPPSIISPSGPNYTASTVSSRSIPLSGEGWGSLGYTGKGFQGSVNQPVVEGGGSSTWTVKGGSSNCGGNSRPIDLIPSDHSHRPSLRLGCGLMALVE